MMANRTISDEIQVQIDHTISQLPVSQKATIVKTYEDNHADLETELGDILKYVQIIGDNTINSNVVLVFLNGDNNSPIGITDNEQTNITNTILALGLGLFTIREDGHLWVELPMGMENPFRIEDDHLIVTLPEDTANDYEIIDKHLIYHRGGNI